MALTSNSKEAADVDPEPRIGRAAESHPFPLQRKPGQLYQSARKKIRLNAHPLTGLVPGWFGMKLLPSRYLFFMALTSNSKEAADVDPEPRIGRAAELAP
jgi:hypothetical protein